MQYLQSEVRVYDKYLTGDVYGYVVENEAGETVESCWGFFGEEDCRHEGQSVIELLQRMAA